MRFVLLLLLLLAACKRPNPAPEIDDKSAQGPCHSLMFEGDRFTVCRDPAMDVELFTADAQGRPLRSFVALEQVLGKKSGKVGFAMNGGMFDEEGRPIGLAIAESRLRKPLNRRTDGGGNFHMQPNGVFTVDASGKAQVVATEDFTLEPTLRVATQSGPMLVIDGGVNPKFDRDGRSRYVRNGAGVDGDGVPVFAISDAPVSFGKFARLFAGPLGCRNALYLDGAVSSLWDPANGRMDGIVPIGPMLVGFRP